MFHKPIISLLTGQFAIKVMTLHWVQFAAMAAVSLYQGYASGKAAKAGGTAARDVAYANAGDLREFSGINADLLLGAAGRNAQAQMTIGEANASAVERATTRNLMLYGMQAEEETRRHVYGERMSAGRIRAMVGAAGVQTNTGTPLAFLYSQVDEGIRQRKFMIAKHEQTMWTMAEEGKDRAGVTRLTASENAAVIMSNAEAQAAVSMLDAERQATAMERGGELAQMTGDANATSAYLGGISSAIGSGIQAYDAVNSPNTGSNLSSFSGWASQQTGWQQSSTNINAINPYPQYGNSLSTSFNTGFTSAVNPFPQYGGG